MFPLKLSRSLDGICTPFSMYGSVKPKSIKWISMSLNMLCSKFFPNFYPFFPSKIFYGLRSLYVSPALWIDSSSPSKPMPRDMTLDLDNYGLLLVKLERLFPNLFMMTNGLPNPGILPLKCIC